MILSRHARNNKRLYQILENEILEAIELPDSAEKKGTKTIVLKEFINRFSGYPLKVVYEKKRNEIFIITAYPLKKKIWR